MNTLQLDDVIEFNLDKRIRKKLFDSENIVCELVCYEPGQGTVEHQHPGQDELFYIIEGKGSFTVDGECLEAKKGDLIHVPPLVKHGIEADCNERLTIIFMKSPARPRPKSKKKIA